jgi:hypothetical protein
MHPIARNRIGTGNKTITHGITRMPADNSKKIVMDPASGLLDPQVHAAMWFALYN